MWGFIAFLWVILLNIYYSWTLPCWTDKTKRIWWALETYNGQFFTVFWHFKDESIRLAKGFSHFQHISLIPLKSITCVTKAQWRSAIDIHCSKIILKNTHENESHKCTCAWSFITMNTNTLLFLLSQSYIHRPAGVKKINKTQHVD